MTGIGRRAGGLEQILGYQPEIFTQVFGEGEIPRVFFAPGRVNLIGEHLDYNGGPVLPMAIGRGTWVSVRPSEESRLDLATSHEPGLARIPLEALPAEPTGSWIDYPLGVVRALVGEDCGDHRGLELCYGGNLPVGAGLSSSASLCAVTALACDALWGLGLSPLERVQAALSAEREFIGLPCGIMDPYAIGLARSGSVLWLDCKDASHTHLPIDLERVGLAVADSGVRRALTDAGYSQRVDECRNALDVLAELQPGVECLRDVHRSTFLRAASGLGSELRKRVEHVLSEVERTFLARDALEAGRIDEFGRLMFESHESLATNFEVSCPELDQLVADASSVEGVHGSRLTGAGFGGCTVILHRLGAEEEIQSRLGGGFQTRFGRQPRIWFFGGDPGPRELERSK